MESQIVQLQQQVKDLQDKANLFPYIITISSLVSGFVFPVIISWINAAIQDHFDKKKEQRAETRHLMEKNSLSGFQTPSEEERRRLKKLQNDYF